MIKVSDYVMNFLADRGIRNLYMITGGGIMHLVDSVGRQDRLKYVCCHHEQACAIAAESEARARCGVGACLVTTGPGSTNALAGIAGAWEDSVPVFVVSGQVRRDLIADYARWRCIGPQEIDIEDMARPVTKFIATVMDPNQIRRILEEAWNAATSGRPGPVWVNIPLDVQGALVDPESLSGATPLPPPPGPSPEDIERVIHMIQAARRPVVLCGNGIHAANAQEAARAFLEKIRAPAVLRIGTMDLFEEEFPWNGGRFGALGQRRANFTVQNSDLLVALGSGLSVMAIGFNTDGFAPRARKVMVNIDPEEATKPHLRLDLAIASDVRAFLEAFLEAARDVAFEPDPRWEQACRVWRETYPTLMPEHMEEPDFVNTYVFADRLSTFAEPGDTVITGNSLDAHSVNHSFRFKGGQRGYTSHNYGAMGWDLPAAVGAAFARPQGRTFLVTGDGSFQLNLQELLTVRQYRLNLKIFIVNNGGYEAIRSMQQNHFQGNIVGADPATGVGNPDYRHLAMAYGLGYASIQRNAEIDAALSSILSEPGPCLCELKVSPNQPRCPKASSFRRPDGTMESRPLEDQWPYLPREEVFRNMHLFDEGPSEPKVLP